MTITHTFQSQDGKTAGYVEQTGDIYFPYGLVFTKQTEEFNSSSKHRNTAALMYLLKFSAGQDAIITEVTNNEHNN